MRAGKMFLPLAPHGGGIEKTLAAHAALIQQ